MGRYGYYLFPEEGSFMADISSQLEIPN